MTRELMVDRVARLLRDEGAGKAWSENAAAEVIDAILPQVATVEELEALPIGSTVLTFNGETWQRGDDSHFHWQGLDSSWHSEDLITNFAPLTVVWRPES